MADAKHGVEVSLRIGQRVRHHLHKDKRVTGIVTTLTLDIERGLMANVDLDEPIIIPARFDGDREVHIHRQFAEVTEFAPFDDRDELIAEMLATLRNALAGLEFARGYVENDNLLAEIDAVIAKTTGAAT